MKKLLFSILVFIALPTHAVMIPGDLDTTLDPSVLFNFQVNGASEQALAGAALPYDSTLGSNFQISNAVASVPVPNGEVGWLDGPAALGKGGLGVCQTADCNNSIDDDFTIGESIVLTIAAAVPFSEIFVGDIHFLNGDHQEIFEGSVEISINGMVQGVFALAAVISDLAGMRLGDGDTIGFAFASREVNAKTEFYVTGFGAEVPIPAALPLFLSALFGFAFFSRRKSAAA